MAKGHENLVPIPSLATERQREIRRMGQAAQVQKKAERKAMRCIADILLGARAELDEEEQAAFERMGFNPDDMTLQAKLVWRQLLKGIAGDTRAAEFVRDTVGEKPTENMSLKHGFMDDFEIRIEPDTEG